MYSGIDWSLTSPAICVLDSPDQSFSFEYCKFFYLTKSKSLEGEIFPNCYGSLYPENWKLSIERYIKLSDWAMKIMINHKIKYVGLEGYSFGSRSGLLFNIAENTQTLKIGLHLRGTEPEIYAPTSVKKFATGTGNSDKQKMHDAFLNETGVNLSQELTPKKGKIGNPVSDIVDAYYICKLLHESICS